MRDFNILIDAKSSFDLRVKNEKEANEKIIEMSNDNDYTNGSLFQKNLQFIAIDLSKKTKLKDPQQINFIGSF